MLAGPFFDRSLSNYNFASINSKVLARPFFHLQLLANDPAKFQSLVEESLRRHVNAINTLSDAGEWISNSFSLCQKISIYPTLSNF